MSYDAVKALLSRGVSRPTLYEVIVPNMSRESQDQLKFLCRRAAVPPMSLNTVTANGHEAQGVTREQPTVVTFNTPFTITVISDRDYIVYKDLKRWFEQIAFNANPYADGAAAALLGLGNSGASQQINYYSGPGGFTRDITLIKLEQQGAEGPREPNAYSEPFRVVFNRAYPVRVGELSLDSGSYDSMMEYTIDFAYETYTFLPEGKKRVGY